LIKAANGQVLETYQSFAQGVVEYYAILRGQFGKTFHLETLRRTWQGIRAAGRVMASWGRSAQGEIQNLENWPKYPP